METRARTHMHHLVWGPGMGRETVGNGREEKGRMGEGMSK